jgi:lipoprotein NlpD
MCRTLPLAMVVALASGCAGAYRPRDGAPSRLPAEEISSHAEAKAAPTTTPDSEGGVVHVVQPGQTLWRIARAYGIPLETIASANGIDDPTRVEVGTPLLIPGATATIDVAPWPAPPPAAAIPPRRNPQPSAAFLWPVPGGELMRPFGEARRDHVHAGVDIRGSAGEAILAARDGTVAFAGPTHGGYGNMIVLDHGDGVQTVYAHAEKLLVAAGDTVRRGETIALVGRTGNATTEHCHFELREDNRPVDPMPFFVVSAGVLSQ